MIERSVASHTHDHIDTVFVLFDYLFRSQFSSGDYGIDDRLIAFLCIAFNYIKGIPVSVSGTCSVVYQDQRSFFAMSYLKTFCPLVTLCYTYGKFSPSVIVI